MAPPTHLPTLSLDVLLVVVFFFFFLIISTCVNSHSIPPLQGFVYGGCSVARFDSNSPYYQNLNSLLTSLVNSATYSSYNHFTVMQGISGPVYGLYQCRGDLSMPDCATCVERAVSQMGAMCPSTCGASLQLQGCYVKYDNQTFFGVEDKTIVMKKFGPSIALDGDKMAGREAVLDGLEAKASGPSSSYRAAGSKGVQGVAQCIGDLSVDQCQDCVDDAVKRLRSECGNAGYGDMFFAKCYARFSFMGAGGYSKSSNNGGYISKGWSVKTFALIAGCLAGIVILVIFFTFVCRTFGGSGK